MKELMLQSLDCSQEEADINRTTLSTLEKLQAYKNTTYILENQDVLHSHKSRITSCNTSNKLLFEQPAHF
jgi:arylamine N-acetyltransferase